MLVLVLSAARGALCARPTYWGKDYVKVKRYPALVPRAIKNAAGGGGWGEGGSHPLDLWSRRAGRSFTTLLFWCGQEKVEVFFFGFFFFGGGGGGGFHSQKAKEYTIICMVSISRDEIDFFLSFFLSFSLSVFFSFFY